MAHEEMYFVIARNDRSQKYEFVWYPDPKGICYVGLPVRGTHLEQYGLSEERANEVREKLRKSGYEVATILWKSLSPEHHIDLGSMVVDEEVEGIISKLDDLGG